MFDIDALRLLVTVAGAASFTKAAASLNCTQSAVSRRIASRPWSRKRTARSSRGFRGAYG